IGIYGWRKHCLYLFILLLFSILVVNFALTLWILRVMHFNMEGMGLLKLVSNGVRLKGVSDFLFPLYVQEIHSREDSPLLVHSSRNVTFSACDENGDLTCTVTIAPQIVEACGQLFKVISDNGGLILSADNTEVVVGADKLRVTGPDGAWFKHSVQTPLITAESFKDLRLESPTRSLIMDAPKGVHMKALAGNMEVTSNVDIHLLTREGMLILDAETLRLPRLPQGKVSVAGSTQGLLEVCVCPDGRLFVSPAAEGSTCHQNSEVC
ncbi:gamma-sarcoglycan-like, partial [Megalops cyprinoides]|uniref:gamma-sarcoglycan-like n=1 Tax=Megalops cyprinoides TaxID=118141 RepID=UPI0018645C35